MSKVAIITDGVNDLSQKIIDEYEITSVPYRLIFEDDTYRIWNKDNSTISTKDMCARMAKCTKDNLPHTSVPSPGDFVKGFEKALEIADSVIAVLISSGMSGSVQSARRTAENTMPNKDITVFDSLHTMTGTGIQALEAAKMAKNGKNKKEIMDRLESINPRVRTIFAMKDLDYLYKQGRIGRAKKLMASAFNVIPIVHMKDGIINPLGSFKGKDTLVKQLKKFGRKLLEHRETEDIFITHVNYADVAQEIYEAMIEANDNGVNIHFYESGSILPVYTGPETINISYIGSFVKEWLFK